MGEIHVEVIFSSKHHSVNVHNRKYGGYGPPSNLFLPTPMPWRVKNILDMWKRRHVELTWVICVVGWGVHKPRWDPFSTARAWYEQDMVVFKCPPGPHRQVVAEFLKCPSLRTCHRTMRCDFPRGTLWHFFCSPLCISFLFSGLSVLHGVFPGPGYGSKKRIWANFLLADFCNVPNYIQSLITSQLSCFFDVFSLAELTACENSISACETCGTKVCVWGQFIPTK